MYMFFLVLVLKKTREQTFRNFIKRFLKYIGDDRVSIRAHATLVDTNPYLIVSQIGTDVFLLWRKSMIAGVRRLRCTFLSFNVHYNLI